MELFSLKCDEFIKFYISKGRANNDKTIQILAKYRYPFMFMCTFRKTCLFYNISSEDKNNTKMSKLL